MATVALLDIPAGSDITLLYFWLLPVRNLRGNYWTDFEFYKAQFLYIKIMHWEM